MAFDSSKVLYSIMSADATLTSMLTTFNSRPALFSFRPVPPSAQRPFVAWEGPLNNNELVRHAEAKHIPRVVHDVACIVDAASGPLAAGAIAHRVYELFYGDGALSAKKSWTGDGLRLIETHAPQGPYNLPTDETLIGRGVSVQLTLRPV